MKNQLITTLFLLFCCLSFFKSVAQTSNTQPPNILFFLIDDLRNTSLGCYGHPIIRTPIIDDLANKGTRFTNAFVTTSICAASRASILTGLYESHHQYTFGKDPIDKSQTDVSYPVLMKKRGYQTGFIGKWGMKTQIPREQLYDYFIPIFLNPYFKKQEDGTLRHEADLCGDYAIEFLKAQESTTPFVLQVSFNSVHAEDGDKENHYPVSPLEKGLYDRQIMPSPRLNDPAIYKAMPDFLKTSLNRERYFWRWDTPEKYQKNMAAYYAMISTVDRIIGKVVQALEENELAENTIIIITGDNGYYMGDRGFAGKWSHFEESLRVPLIIYDPRNSQSQTKKEMVLNIDLPATMLGMAEVSIPRSYQGKNMYPLIKGSLPKKWRTSFFVEHRMDHKAIPKWEGIRHQQYVYANYYEQQPAYEFLHDLSKDPDQLVNLATDKNYKRTLKKMRRLVRKKEKKFF